MDKPGLIRLPLGRKRPDLPLRGEQKTTRAGNPFVICGELGMTDLQRAAFSAFANRQ